MSISPLSEISKIKQLTFLKLSIRVCCCCSWLLTAANWFRPIKFGNCEKRPFVFCNEAVCCNKLSGFWAKAFGKNTFNKSNGFCWPKPIIDEYELSHWFWSCACRPLFINGASKLFAFWIGSFGVLFIGNSLVFAPLAIKFSIWFRSTWECICGKMFGLGVNCFWACCCGCWKFIFELL